MGFSLFGKSDSKGASEGASIWNALASVAQLDDILQASVARPQLLFKHSTRCIISKTVLRNFESDWDREHDGVDLHLLDLLAHRDVSDAIAAKTAVEHQSPQLILLRDGAVVLHASHQAIKAAGVEDALT